MLITEVSQRMAKVLNRYFHLFHQRKYSELEKEVLTYIGSSVIKGKTTSFKLILLVAIYSEFNSLYMDWAKRNNISEEKEIQTQYSNEHENLFIAHCSDPASMDDLLWEVNNYLEDHTERSKHEVEYQLACYRKSLL